jgi:hypothetical protein
VAQVEQRTLVAQKYKALLGQMASQVVVAVAQVGLQFLPGTAQVEMGVLA